MAVMNGGDTVILTMSKLMMCMIAELISSDKNYIIIEIPPFSANDILIMNYNYIILD